MYELRVYNRRADNSATMVVVGNGAQQPTEPNYLSHSRNCCCCVKKSPDRSMFFFDRLTFVSALLELFVVGCLLDEVKDRNSQVRPGERVRLRVDSIVRH